MHDRAQMNQIILTSSLDTQLRVSAQTNLKGSVCGYETQDDEYQKIHEEPKERTKDIVHPRLLVFTQDSPPKRDVIFAPELAVR